MSKNISPLAVLHRSNGSQVRVRLKSGVEFEGELEVCDEHMNIVLQNAKELDLNDGSIVRKFGRLFIRGNNVLFITMNHEK